MAESSSTRAVAIADLARAMRDFMAHAVLFQDAVARSVGLNSSDLQAVGLLMDLGPSTAGELAERTGLTAGGAVTAMIDRLERAGYVTRRRDEKDRRRVIVSANERKILADVGATYGRITDRWMEYVGTLTDDQLAFATDLITQATRINKEGIEHLRDAP